MRLYYFTPSQFGLEAVRDRRLKAARVAALNDPFELQSVLSGPGTGNNFKGLKQLIDTDQALLCMSASWRHPMMWAHYAGNHTGLCLGFDVDDDVFVPVRYVNERTPSAEFDPKDGESVQDAGLRLIDHLLRTKFDAWAYEREYRSYLNLEGRDPVSGLHFVSFEPAMKLKEVIVGLRSAVQPWQLAELLKDRPEVLSFRVRPANRTFEMVVNGRQRAWPGFPVSYPQHGRNTASQ